MAIHSWGVSHPTHAYLPNPPPQPPLQPDSNDPFASRHRHIVIGIENYGEMFLKRMSDAMLHYYEWAQKRLTKNTPEGIVALSDVEIANRYHCIIKHTYEEVTNQIFERILSAKRVEPGYHRSIDHIRGQIVNELLHIPQWESFLDYEFFVEDLGRRDCLQAGVQELALGLIFCLQIHGWLDKDFMFHDVKRDYIVIIAR